jgi:hypothetical protein
MVYASLVKEQWSYEGLYENFVRFGTTTHGCLLQVASPQLLSLVFIVIYGLSISPGNAQWPWKQGGR